MTSDVSEQEVASIEETKEDLKAPTEVDVVPLAEDFEIEDRLLKILEATTWFSRPRVKVDEGVVFLSGQTQTPEHKLWAGDLARNTQDVVAVVNRINVAEKPIWDLSPAWKEILKLTREAVQILPLLGIAVLLLLLTWLASGLAVRLTRRILRRRIKNRLLINVSARAVAIPVFLVGLYLALRVSGLTQIAATVLGGTGLVGLVIGIAFRDIAENFLASVLISIQRPFALGDKITVDGHVGIVQSVTARGTLLMTMDGNHIQIPNSSIYKSVIRNETANPKLRCEFLIGIDYGDSITEAQDVALQVLRDHIAVLVEPDPMVIVEELGASTVNIRVYFWINSHEHSAIKVRSSVIRLTKLAFESAGLTLPDESREVIFPRGVPVLMHHAETDATLAASDQRQMLPETTPSTRPEMIANAAEDDLSSEDEVINEQARQSRSPEEGENLLEA
ncbi:MAG: mechanosensitive ion channel [Planctomycetales bacterium]|nr:mechanosensitive ion channel [Planctomycetales bacterium]